MSRYLFVVPPLAGHVNPAAGVAAELGRRGHEVAWVAHEGIVGHLLGAEARTYPAGDGFLEELAGHAAERERVKGPASVQFLWERVLVPLARDMAGPVGVAADDFAPDVVVTDQQAFAGGIVAAQRGLPWAVIATTTADLGDPFALVPKVGEWMRRQLDQLLSELGLDHLAAAGFDPRYSPHLVLACSTAALAGDAAGEGMPLAFVGPVLPQRAEPVPFPWEWLERHEVNVLVTLGTVSQDIGGRFMRAALEAVAGEPYGAVVVAPDGSLPDPPGNALLRPFVPQLDLLPRMGAVVCHAGHNTTVEALSFGVPLVCAPIRDDQPVTAGQVLRAGAGLRVSFGRARASAVRDAIGEVLHDPSYREAAARVGESFRAAGGAPAAADHLEAVAAPGAAVPASTE